jgi:hypothetical protein
MICLGSMLAGYIIGSIWIVVATKFIYAQGENVKEIVRKLKDRNR